MKHTQTKGAVIMYATLFFLFISLIVIVGVVEPVASQVRFSGEYLQSSQSFATAEALNDDAFYRLNKGYTLPANITLSLNNSTSGAVVTDVGSTKQVVSQGIDGALTRTVQSNFILGTGVAFNYGLQVGNGGLSMSGSTKINGNVYSNGDISGSGGAAITGSALVANQADPTPDQISSGTTTPPYNIVFGTSSVAEDFSQSFVVSTTSPLTEILLYIKKAGTISNLTIRIATDSAGKPGTVLASGVISSSLITTSYGWVAVDPTTNPSLTPNTTYWLVVDAAPASYNAANYFSIGADQNIYPNGSGLIGKYTGTWNVTSPSNLDSYFKIYLGGNFGSISGMNVGTAGVGDVQAHTVTSSTVAGTIYCQSGTGNNKNCDTSKPDPSPNANAISDANIAEWKADATAGTTRGSLSIGGSTSTTTSGATIINGDLTIGNSGILTIKGTLYVTGNITLNGQGQIKLDTSYGNTSGIIICDGLINVGAGGTVSGNGNTGSYALLVTTSSSTSAITSSGGAGAVVYVAQNGTINFNGGASAKSAIGYKMIMSGGTSLNYDSGLTNVNFSSGPSGAWNVQSWNEIAQ